MDERQVFILVFLFTLLSTALIAFVSLLTGQGWVVTILYSLVTMWITGVLSQIVLKHLYLQVVYPMELERTREEIANRKVKSSDLEEVEAIDDAINLIEEKGSSERGE